MRRVRHWLWKESAGRLDGMVGSAGPVRTARIWAVRVKGVLSKKTI
ncbi:MAG: hypothetical protein RIC30_02370 [Marinoscillum sp.]